MRFEDRIKIERFFGLKDEDIIEIKNALYDAYMHYKCSRCKSLATANVVVAMLILFIFQMDTLNAAAMVLLMQGGAFLVVGVVVATVNYLDLVSNAMLIDYLDVIIRLAIGITLFLVYKNSDIMQVAISAAIYIIVQLIVEIPSTYFSFKKYNKRQKFLNEILADGKDME